MLGTISLGDAKQFFVKGIGGFRCLVIKVIPTFTPIWDMGTILWALEVSARTPMKMGSYWRV